VVSRCRSIRPTGDAAMNVSAEQRAKRAIALSQRALERITGGLLTAYMAAVIVSVTARVASNADQESFRTSLQLIAANQGLYLTNLASNFLLIALAAGLYLTFRTYQRYLALLGASMFTAAALIWMVSNTSGLTLAQLAQEFATASGPLVDMFMTSPRVAELTREFAGKTAFTLASLGLLAFGGLIAWSHAVPRWLGWLAIVVGVLIAFIWYDAASALHRIGGTGYLLWLLFTGGWLLLRGTKDSVNEKVHKCCLKSYWRFTYSRQSYLWATS
jgi:hypothetical protein